MNTQLQEWLLDDAQFRHCEIKYENDQFICKLTAQLAENHDYCSWRTWATEGYSEIDFDSAIKYALNKFSELKP